MMRCFSAGAVERFGRISLLKFPSHKIVAMAVCMLSAATTARAGVISTSRMLLSEEDRAGMQLPARLAGLSGH